MTYLFQNICVFYFINRDFQERKTQLKTVKMDVIGDILVRHVSCGLLISLKLAAKVYGIS